MSDSEEEEVRSERSASDAADDEANELAPTGEAAEEESEEDEAPAPAPAADAGAISLFLPYNKGFHTVTKQTGGKSGCVRCYHRTVKVETGERLGQLVESHKAWPKGKDLKDFVSADKIVVVNGHDKVDDAEMRSVWFVLFEVEGTSNRQDSQILRHIPKQVYKELIDSIKKDPTMAESSLLRMQATNDNEKSLNPSPNNFVKTTESEKPRSSCVMPEKKRPEKKPEKPPEKPKEKGAEKKDDKAEKGDKADKSSATKQSSMSFWKPKSTAVAEDKTPVEKPAEKPAEKRKPDSAPADEPPKKAEKTEKPKEPKDDKESKAAPPAPSEESKPSAPAPAAKKREREEGNGKTMFKRKRTAVVEEHEFMICDPNAKLDFPVPEGAIGGKATITWSFA